MWLCVVIFAWLHSVCDIVEINRNDERKSEWKRTGTKRKLHSASHTAHKEEYISVSLSLQFNFDLAKFGVAERTSTLQSVAAGTTCGNDEIDFQFRFAHTMILPLPSRNRGETEINTIIMSPQLGGKPIDHYECTSETEFYFRFFSPSSTSIFTGSNFSFTDFFSFLSSITTGKEGVSTVAVKTLKENATEIERNDLYSELHVS